MESNAEFWWGAMPDEELDLLLTEQVLGYANPMEPAGPIINPPLQPVGVRVAGATPGP